MVKSEQESHPDLGRVDRRYVDRRRDSLLMSFIEALSPHEVVDRFGGLDRAKAIMDGGNGLIVLFAHPTIRDSVDMGRFVARSGFMRDKQILAPIAVHQHKWYADLVSRYFGVSLRPIITRHTVENHPELTFSRQEKASMLRDYVNDILTTVKNGGIGLVAPQADRDSGFGEPKGTVSLIMKNAARQGIENFGFLFVSPSADGVVDYAESGGYNPGKPYTLYIGRAYTFPEAADEVAASWESYDNWAYGHLIEAYPDDHPYPYADIGM